MDVNDWIQGEVFIKQQLAWLVLVMLCFGFVIIFCLLYFTKSHPKQSKWAISSSLLVIASLSVFIWVKFHDYQFYISNIEKIPYITQKFEKSLLVGEKNHEMVRMTPKIKHMRELDEFVLYHKETQTYKENVEYLGKSENVYYFRFYHTIYNMPLNSELIVFDDQLQAPEIKAASYRLKDQGFTEAGFYPDIGPIYYQLRVPATEQHLVYDNVGKTKALSW
ncbi:hypothetical protein [Vagococcus zengguangii]|uniref:Uncharacterized protein n=1 Tax=Vagococcus zengguangii TaxID=2571750 RepID=A0A4D7CX51_9ENTE|nr:hypothetical protein [Vagococcus zengguangii]QCI86977.1 hypothetical protein FA707_08355 [Vagococcus zengguangii]TLG80980.1 hypothetical protein FE258_03605 [Vagococcus zengguangii]